jgi:hypothetical protein
MYWTIRESIPVQTGPGAQSASYIMGSESLPGVKRPGHDVNQSTPSRAGVKKRVELWLMGETASGSRPMAKKLLYMDHRQWCNIHNVSILPATRNTFLAIVLLSGTILAISILLTVISLYS